MSIPNFAKAPDDASPLVKEAYTRGLSPNRVGLTQSDRRQLRSAVRRGDLVYHRNLNLPGNWWLWEPAFQEREE